MRLNESELKAVLKFLVFLVMAFGTAGAYLLRHTQQ